MIKRIVSFGCSNTFGEGLPDKWDSVNNRGIYDNQPSKYAWPQIVANKLNIDCKNRALYGESNKFIVDRVLNTEYQEEDIVVILWTYFSRSCIFQDDKSSKRLMIQDIKNNNIPKDHRKFTKQYYSTFYTNTNAIIETYMHINLAKHHLDSLGIKNFHYTCDKQDNNSNIGLSQAETPAWSAVTLPEIRLPQLDVALDRSHPGPKSQERFADIVIEDSKLKGLL